jgi:hypothetical protein
LWGNSGSVGILRGSEKCYYEKARTNVGVLKLLNRQGRPELNVYGWAFIINPLMYEYIGFQVPKTGQATMTLALKNRIDLLRNEQAGNSGKTKTESRVTLTPTRAVINDMAVKGEDDGTQPGNGERTLGSLGKSKAGDFASAKNVAGAVYLASTIKARSRDIRSEEERQLKEFAQQHGLMLEAGPMMVEVERQGISGLDNHVFAKDTAFIKINVTIQHLVFSHS